MMVWLGSTILRWPSMILRWPSISCPPHMTDVGRDPPPHWLVRGVWWSNLVINSASKQKALQYSLVCQMEPWVTLHRTSSSSSATNLTSLSPPKKKTKLYFPVGPSFFPFNCPLGCLQSITDFPLSVLGHCSCSSASPPDHYENHLDYVDLSLMVPLGFIGFHFCHCSCIPALPAWLPREPSYLSGLEPGSPLWFVQVCPYLPLNKCPLVTWISILFIKIWICQYPMMYIGYSGIWIYSIML